MANSQRFPLQVALNRIALKQAQAAIELTGKSLPASIISVQGAIVTVQFELLTLGFQLPQVTIPIMGSSYVREPYQTGDMGFVVAIDANIFGAAGITTEIATLDNEPNLTSLVFFPVGQMDWTVTDPVNPEDLVLTGYNDVLLRDDNYQVGLEAINTAWTNLITDINNLLLIIGPGLHPSVTLTPLSPTLNPVVPRT